MLCSAVVCGEYHSLQPAHFLRLLLGAENFSLRRNTAYCSARPAYLCSSACFSIAFDFGHRPSNNARKRNTLTDFFGVLIRNVRPSRFGTHQVGIMVFLSVHFDDDISYNSVNHEIRGKASRCEITAKKRVCFGEI